MAWNIDMVTLLRHMIADVGVITPGNTQPTYTYDDDTLQQLIVAAAQLMQGEVSFANQYTIDISGLSISPDPTLPGTKDDAFINLATTKAACIIDNSEARKASNRAVMMRDSSKQVDLRQISIAKLAIWQKGWCQNYKDARFEFMAGNTAAAGAAVTGPFRLEMNWMPGPWTPDGYGVGIGAGTYFYGGGGMNRDTPNDGRYR